ncbi:MAG: SDR family NAD(P)-dependent oxidoreductase [Gulosibacter sp.]|uniref:SDR family NAD(P)-dependent oxidoreductase n=1 Tax=Gulosibacter sp. TaxID=2817531 RepID=UPI003F901451
MINSAVVITGAAQGQGAAHAEALAKAGYRVVLTDVQVEAGEATAARIREAGGDAQFRKLDVTSAEDWANFAAELRASEVPLRGLVNNAGILRYASIAETTVELWQFHDRVNVHGPFLGIQALAPLMVDAGGGSIVNVSSTAALMGAAGYAAYSASKAAILGLTRVAAVEYGPSVRVNAICPGGVATPMNDFEPQGGSSSAAPLGRRADPAEISPLITYLIGTDSSFMTGSALTIDGGLTAI